MLVPAKPRSQKRKRAESIRRSRVVGEFFCTVIILFLTSRRALANILLERSTNYHEKTERLLRRGIAESCSRWICGGAKCLHELCPRATSSTGDRGRGPRTRFGGVEGFLDERGIEYVALSECDCRSAPWRGLAGSFSGRQHGRRDDCELRSGEGNRDCRAGAGQVSECQGYSHACSFSVRAPRELNGGAG